MSATARGLLWVFLAGLTFVIFIVIVRFVGSSLHPVQAAFIRYALGIVVIAPLFMRRGVKLLHTNHLGRHALRGCVHAVGVMLWFFAVTRLPIAETTALSFTSPIFVVLGAVLFLDERLTLVRVLSVVSGFIGVLIILRPGFSVFNLGAVAMLVAAPMFAASKLLVKFLVRSDSSGTVVAHLAIFATLTMLVPAMLVWQTPSMLDVLLLLGTAVFATASHLCMARGLALIDVSVSQPVEFLQIVWSTLFGLALFSESPSLWVWVGAAVIVLGTTVVARSETRADAVAASV